MKPYSLKTVVFQERFGNIWGHSKNSLAGKGGGCLKANKIKQGEWYFIHTAIRPTK